MNFIRLLIGTFALAVGLNSVASWAAQGSLKPHESVAPENDITGHEEPPCLSGG